MFLYKIVFCFAIINISITSVWSQNNEGDSCVMEGTNSAGECLLITNCPAALEGIQRGEFPETCGYKGTVPIVCCEKKQISERAPGDISKEKCVEYSGYAWELEYSQTFSLIKKKVNVSVCGFVVAPFVIGGTKAKAKEFPHMALLGYGEPNNILWRCGGTLVSEQFVMTAAHCLYSREFGALRWVRLGDLNIKSSADDADPVEFSIETPIRHPDYKSPSQYNDIALVKLNRPATFNRYIRPACLSFEPVPDERFLATGWGLTERDGQKGSDTLLKVGISRFSHSECNASYENVISDRRLKFGILPDTQLCAGGKNEEKDTCQGDSGGPLQIYHKTVHCMYTVVGVTSFGKSCGVRNVPGVYTRVASYIKWLEDTIWPQ